MRRGISTIAMAAAMAAGQASAQEVIDLGEITVTANRVATGLSGTGASVAVIGEEELEEAGEVQLIDVLRRLPGVSVTQGGPAGSGANVRIRGADARYIAVYIDGIRVADPSLIQSQFDFGGLTTADLSRVELLRGSQSALYGGSAVGGVIAITTRRAAAEGLAQHVTLEAGSYGTVAGSYGFTRGGAGGEVALTLSHLRTDGFSAADEDDGNTEADGFRATRLSFSARHRLTDAVTLGGAAFWQDGRSEYDGFDPASFALVDQDNVVDRVEWGARVYAEVAAGGTDHLFDLSVFDTDRRFNQEGALSSFEGRRVTLSWQGTTPLSDAVSLVYGADWTEERARYTALPQGEETARIAGAFAQALWAPTDAIDVSATVRVDDTSNFGAFTSGRLALAYRPDDTTTLRAAVARGFRAPSIDERFGDYGFFVGNPDLGPEKSLSYEIGVEKALGGGASVSATLFHLEIDDLITYDAGVFPNTLVNVAGESRRRGLELGAAVPLGGRVMADLAYTYTDAERPDGRPIDLVPLHELELGVSAELAPKLRGRVAARHVAGVIEFGAANPDYTVVDLGLDYALTDAMDVSLRVENLLDEAYQTVRGYGTSDRAVYVGLSSSF